MKIRCEKNSVRLRLRRSEIAQIRNEHQIATAVRFPGGISFRWELLLDEHPDDMSASFDDHQIRVTLPMKSAMAWIDSDQVGMEAFQPLEGGESLHILVEKDFPCKDRPEEDNAEFFEDLASRNAPVC